MARKIRCTAPDGTTFERRTDREYTHAVVSQVGPKQIQRLERGAKDEAAAEAVGNPANRWYRDAVVRVRAEAAAGRFTYVTWHQRADLAAKEAAKRNADPYYANAVIVPVEL